jgi:hypothetical protein
MGEPGWALVGWLPIFLFTSCAAASGPCVMTSSWESAQTFCAFFPVFSDSHVADLYIFLRKLPTRCNSCHPHQFPGAETFITIFSVYLSALWFSTIQCFLNIYVVGHRMSSCHGNFLLAQMELPGEFVTALPSVACHCMPWQIYIIYDL